MEATAIFGDLMSPNLQGLDLDYVQVYPEEDLGLSARYVGPQFKADVYFYQNERSVGLWKISGDAFETEFTGAWGEVVNVWQAGGFEDLVLVGRSDLDAADGDFTAPAREAVCTYRRNGVDTRSYLFLTRAEEYFLKVRMSFAAELYGEEGDALCRDLSGTVAAAVRETPSMCPETVEIAQRIFEEYYTEIAELGHAVEPEALHVVSLLCLEADALRYGQFTREDLSALYFTYRNTMLESPLDSGWNEALDEFARDLGVLTEENIEIAQYSFHQAVVNRVLVRLAVNALMAQDGSSVEAGLEPGRHGDENGS